MTNILIGPINDGLRKDLKPWATPEDSWETLINAYQWRGRIVRRQGYTSLDPQEFESTQLSFQISAQVLGASAMNFTANLFAVFTLTGVVVVPETIRITVNGAANYVLVEDEDNRGTFVQLSGAGTDFLNGTINFNTGDIALNFSVNPGGNVVITFSYAYMLPVMGLRTRELFELNEQDLIAFDTKFSYRYSNTNSQFQPLASVMQFEWSGTNYQFFFTTNYAGAFWATNFKSGLNGADISNIVTGTPTTITTSSPHGFTTGQTVTFINIGGTTELNGTTAVITVTTPTEFTVPTATTNAYTSNGIALNSQVSVVGQDGIRYYAQTSVGNTWVNYNPPIDPNKALTGALMIFPYRGYLVFLNTWEGNDTGVFNYGNRARWTQIGTPYYSEPVPISPNPQTVDPNAARDDLFGRGGATDAPTQEVIVGATFIRDILIVAFERSTWRLRFVNNSQNPFVWERINVELGCDSTFSIIPFDKGMMAISERGIVISDVNDTVRIDDKIPNDVFDIRIQNNGMERVYGIRTFRTRLNYWTFPSHADDNRGTFPNRVLVFNYDTKNWSYFDDTFTCFGYHYAFNDRTWADLTLDWSEYGKITWGGGESQPGYENVVAGNQQGFVFLLEQNSSQNNSSLYISDITGNVFTSTNNNLLNETWVELYGLTGVTDADGTPVNGRRYRIVNPSNPSGQPNTFTLEELVSIPIGFVTDTQFDYTLGIPFISVYAGSVDIWIGDDHYTDPAFDGVLVSANGNGNGTIDYLTGRIRITFIVPIVNEFIVIRIVSVNPDQGFQPLELTGTYTGGGYLRKISNIDMQTKIFNFLQQDQSVRLSWIDFYVDATEKGEFTCNVFADSSNVIVNTPLSDNPRSNVVETSPSPYQDGLGEQTVYRLYSDVASQTVQLQLMLTDQQMAVPVIADSNIEILAMNFKIRKGGRLV